MNFVLQRLTNPRKSAAVLFAGGKTIELRGILITVAGHLTFGLIPQFLAEQNLARGKLTAGLGIESLVSLVIISFFTYYLFSFLLWLLLKIFRNPDSFRNARIVSGNSFWVPFCIVAPVVLVLFLISGGAPLSPYLRGLMAFPIRLLLLGMVLWGYAILVLTISERLHISKMRSTIISALATFFLIAISISPIVFYAIFVS